MSKPLNPLANFQNYSYHHILVACQNTAVAEALSTNTSLDLMSRSRETTRFSPLELPSKGKYVILIDGREDIDFAIESISWETLFAPPSSSGGGYTTMETEGSLTVLEPKAARFLNVVAESCKSFRVSYQNVVYLLKTVFIGYRPTGNLDGSTTEIIPTVRPLMFHIYDIVASFDAIKGTTYAISFISSINGVGKLPKYSLVADGVTSGVTAGENTLEQVMKEFETRLQEKSDRDYKEQLESAKKSGAIDDTGSIGIRLQYKIILDDAYTGDNANKYLVNITHPTTEDTGNQDPVHSFGNGTIESAIKELMDSSGQVMQDAAGEEGVVSDTGGKLRYQYKVHSTIKSSKEDYIVYHIVKRYEIKTSDFTSIFSKDFPESAGAKGNTIEFDYFFTGNNTDIVEFDMKMENALFFLQTIATTDSIPKNAEDNKSGLTTNTKTVAGGPNTGPNGSSPIYENDPVAPIQRQTDKDYKNKESSELVSSFRSALNRFSGFETIEAHMTIVGNVNLLDNLNITPAELRGESVRQPKEGDVMRDWPSLPGLAKINIFFPSSSDTFETGPYEPLWFRGLYYIFAVENIFQDGLFTQKLEMMGLMTENPYEMDQTENKEKDTSGDVSSGNSTSDESLEKAENTKVKDMVSRTKGRRGTR